MNTYVTGATRKELRESRKLTQAELAERIGVSSKTVSKWETGKGLPDISLLQPLAQALGISPNGILGDFDSLGHAPEGERVIRHPVEKDDTDMLLAVRTGMEAGCRDFIIYGGSYERFNKYIC